MLVEYKIGEVVCRSCSYKNTEPVSVSSIASDSMLELKDMKVRIHSS